jgi:hypothetical protein
MLNKAKEVSLKALGQSSTPASSKHPDHEAGWKGLVHRPNVSDETEKIYEDRLGLLY